MRTVFSLLLALWSAAGAAQTMYKCVDDERRVTYSNIACDKQDLQDAGTVADRSTTMPFVPTQKLSPRPESAKESGKEPADPKKK